MVGQIVLGLRVAGLVASTTLGLTILRPYGDASQCSNGLIGVFSSTTRVNGSGALVLTIGATM